MRAGSRRSRGARRNRWSTAMTSRRGRKTGVTNSKSPAAVTISTVRSTAVLALGLAAGCLLQQALATQQSYLVQMRGDLRTELLSVQQQLVSVQELTGFSEPPPT